jgi:ribosome-associated protein
MAARKTVARKRPAIRSESLPAEGRTAGRTRLRKRKRPEAEALAVDAARFADDTKAESIVVLDVSAVSSITDYFVICTGTSLPHLKAIVRDVRERMTIEHAVKPSASEGQTESQWLVLDYGVLMFHAFHRTKRELYALEDLWGDARVVEWDKA